MKAIFKHMNNLVFKFLFPFSAFLLVVYIGLIVIYEPVYKKVFINEKMNLINNIRTDIYNWLLYFDSKIEIIRSYNTSHISKEDMLNAFGEILKDKGMVDLYFANDIPYKDGGSFINLLESSLPPDYDQTTREWYQGALKTTNFYICAPYIAATTGKVVVTFAKAVYTNNALKGIIGMDISLKNLDVIADKYSSKSGITMNVVTDKGVYLNHKDPQYLLNENNTLVSNPLFANHMNDLLNNNIFYNLGKKDWIMSTHIPYVTWICTVYGDTSQLNKSIMSFRLMSLVVILLLILLETILVLLIAKPISNSLNIVSDNISKMSDGNFHIQFNEKYVNKKDEMGKVVNSINRMQVNISEVIYNIKSEINVINNDAVTIVNDTISFLVKKISYNIMNIDNPKCKLINPKNHFQRASLERPSSETVASFLNPGFAPKARNGNSGNRPADRDRSARADGPYAQTGSSLPYSRYLPARNRQAHDKPDRTAPSGCLDNREPYPAPPRPTQ